MTLTLQTIGPAKTCGKHKYFRRFIKCRILTDYDRGMTCCYERSHFIFLTIFSTLSLYFIGVNLGTNICYDQGHDQSIFFLSSEIVFFQKSRASKTLDRERPPFSLVAYFRGCGRGKHQVRALCCGARRPVPYSRVPACPAQPT